MIRKFLIAAAAALVLGGCATGYGYSGHGNSGYDAYGDYYHGSGYGYDSYGGYGGYGLGGGLGYYGGYGGHYGYGSPWYGGSSWYGWPGYGYYPPYRPPHRPDHGRPGLDRPPVIDPPGQSQARPRLQGDWSARPPRTITPNVRRAPMPAGSGRTPSRIRERALERPPVDAGRPTRTRVPVSRPQSPGAGSTGSRLRTSELQPRAGARLQTPARVAPSLGRPQGPARVAAPPRQVERARSAAPRPSVRASSPSLPERAGARRARLVTP